MSQFITPTQNVNSPTAGTGATALASNTNRQWWQIQNQGVAPIYIALGTGATSIPGGYHFAIAGGATAGDGTGGMIGPMGAVVYTGPITVAGASPRYSVLEH